MEGRMGSQEKQEKRRCILVVDGAGLANHVIITSVFLRVAAWGPPASWPEPSSPPAGALWGCSTAGETSSTPSWWWSSCSPPGGAGRTRWAASTPASTSASPRPPTASPSPPSQPASVSGSVSSSTPGCSCSSRENQDSLKICYKTSSGILRVPM